MSTQNYNATTGLPLTRGSIAGTAIGAGANNDQDIACVSDSTLIVEADMTAGAAPDLAVVVQPYEADNQTVMPVSLPTLQTVGPTLAGGHAYYYAQFDVQGVDRVRLRVTNNNAGGQTITRLSWRLT